jgi:hypothetical protein
MAVAPAPVYQEVYYFLASAPSREAILAFRPSEETQERLRQLLALNAEERATETEQAELDEFEQVEHFVRMLKLYTQQLINKSSEN